jgi:hypothetical protein
MAHPDVLVPLAVDCLNNCLRRADKGCLIRDSGARLNESDRHLSNLQLKLDVSI